MGSVDPLSWIGLGTDVLGMGSSYAANQYAADKQYKATQETNAQNYKIWQESQDFSREQADTQWEREKEMFNMENSYNNPVNVVGRLREAGLNPALAMQGSLGSAMSSAASGGSPTIGSSPTAPTMQVPAIGQYYSNIANGITDASLKASQMLKNIADAKKSGVETRKLESMLNIEIERGELDNEYQRLQNHFERYYGDIKRTRENELLYQNIQKVIQDQFTSASQGHLNYEMACKAAKEIESLTEQMRLTREQRKLLEKENKVFFSTWNRDMAVKSSEIANNIASSNEHNEGANLKRSQKEGQDISNSWIDEEKASSVAETESRTEKNKVEASSEDDIKRYRYSKKHWRDNLGKEKSQTEARAAAKRKSRR